MRNRETIFIMKKNFNTATSLFFFLSLQHENNAKNTLRKFKNKSKGDFSFLLSFKIDKLKKKIKKMC